MDLLTSSWIPVRADGGSGRFRLLTYEELLCGSGAWTVSLPRDDLELACIQLLACMTQAMFIPDTETQWRERLAQPMSPEAFADGVAPCREWFDLDHPSRPFMQTRGIQSKDITPIQKLLIGLPEGNNHAFFNAVGEVRRLGGAMAAVALFNQASNCPSFGGGFKGSLRGGSPVTTLVEGKHLRETVWRNVLTLENVQKRLPDYQPDPAADLPTWVRPIREKETIQAPLIGLVRGLFWQPAHVELVRHEEEAPCDFLGCDAGPVYSGFRKEKFGFTVEGVWPHPHGAMIDSEKKGVKERKFVSFTTAAPAWTQLSEFVVPRTLDDKDTKEGCTPAGPVVQADELLPGALHLMVGGYRTNQASVIERRHELVSLARGWAGNKDRLKSLVDFGKDARLLLRGKLYFASQGHKDKGMKGIGAPIHDMADKLFYARTEFLIQETFANEYTFKEWKQAKAGFSEKVCEICRTIYEELTDSYAHKPELIPIIAWARRSLNGELSKMTEKLSQ
jgi:CRISPR system Cascade subunit CasA